MKTKYVRISHYQRTDANMEQNQVDDDQSLSRTQYMTGVYCIQVDESTFQS